VGQAKLAAQANVCLGASRVAAGGRWGIRLRIAKGGDRASAKISEKTRAVGEMISEARNIERKRKMAASAANDEGWKAGESWRIESHQLMAKYQKGGALAKRAKRLWRALKAEKLVRRSYLMSIIWRAGR